MNFKNIEVAKDYETLLVQFNALRRILKSKQSIIDLYNKKIQEFSVERVIQLEAEIESQKEMNAILTKELLSKRYEKIRDILLNKNFATSENTF
jgi:hypothetical protein